MTAREPNLRVRIGADARELVQEFARSKRSLRELEADARQATSAVAATARSLRQRPGDATLTQEFERLTRAAAQTKQTFVAKRTETQQLRNALAAQGVSVSNLAADWRRLNAAQTQAGGPTSQPMNAMSRNAAMGMNAPSRMLSNQDQLEGLRGIEGSVDGLSGRIGAMGNVIAGVFSASLLLPHLQTLSRISDEYLNFNAQLALATRNGGNLADAQADVARIARTAASGISETAVLYARLAPSVRALGLAQSEVANITEVVALSLRISGASAAESGSAILQLAQAFGSGALRGEEFNSVNEAAPRLMQALADALGVPRGELRALAEQGRLSAEVLALALPQALGQLRAEAASMPNTVGAAFVQLRNEFVLLVGQVNQGVGVFSLFANAVTALANNLSAVLAALTAATAAYFARRLAGVAAARIAEVAAERARLAATAQQAAATAAAQASELRGIAALAAAERARAAAATAATAATTAATSKLALGARTAIALLTGPVGLAVSIGLAALAWVGFARSGTAALDEVIARQRELNTLQGKPPAERAAAAASAADPRRERLERAEAELAPLQQQIERERRNLERLRQQEATLLGHERGAHDPAQRAQQRLSALEARYREGRAAIAAQRAQMHEEHARAAQQQADLERRLREALNAPAPAAGSGTGTGTGGGGGGAARIARDTAQAQRQREQELERERAAAERLAQAQRDLAAHLAEQTDRLGADTIARDIERNRQAWAARTISAEAYYQRLSELQQAQSALERQALQRRLSDANAAQARAQAAGDAPAALAAQGDAARLQTDLELLERRLADLQQAAAAGLAQAQQQRTRAQADALAAQIDQEFARLAQREQQLRNQTELGLPQLAAEAQVNAARRETLATTSALLAQLERLVALQPALFDAGMSERIERLRANLEQVGVVSDSIAQRINGALGSSLERLFTDVAQGTATLAGALRSFLRSMLAEIQAIMARNLAQNILGRIGGAGGGGGLGGLISGWLGGLFGRGFAQGGYTGPGGKYQPAGIVHAGEYVFPAQAVRRLGVASLAALQRFATGAHVPSSPRLAYAEGGAVRLPAAAAAAPAAQSIRIVNTLDPELARDYLESAAGERVIVNAIARNAAAVRQYLA